MKNNFPFLVLFTLFTGYPLQAQDSAAPTWTSKEGKVFRGSFSKLDGEAVVIMKDGKEFTLPFARLSQDSVSQAKKLGGAEQRPVTEEIKGETPVASPSQATLLKPAWILPEKHFADSSGHVRWCHVRAMTTAGNVFFQVGAQQDPTAAVALVDGNSGKTISIVEFPKPPEGFRESIRDSAVAPDGRIVFISLSLKEKEPDKKTRAQVHLRGFDPTTGKLLTHQKISFDTGKLDGESGEVSWTRAFESQIRWMGSSFGLATPYFLAEIDPNTLKPLAVSLVPDAPGNGTRVTMLGHGALWEITSNKQTFLSTAILGGKVHRIESAKPGLTNMYGSAGAMGTVMTRCYSPDMKEAILGAYDPAKAAWIWSLPGMGQMDMNFANLDVKKWCEIYWPDTKETHFYDEAGNQRFKLPGAAWVIRNLPGRELVIPRAGPNGNQTNEIIVLNYTTGAVEAKLVGSRPFRQPQAFPLPGNKFLIIEHAVTGAEIILADLTTKTLSAPRTVSADLPSSISSIIAVCNGTNCVIDIRCQNKGERFFCAFPVPKN